MSALDGVRDNDALASIVGCLGAGGKLIGFHSRTTGPPWHPSDVTRRCRGQIERIRVVVRTRVCCASRRPSRVGRVLGRAGPFNSLRSRCPAINTFNWMTCESIFIVQPPTHSIKLDHLQATATTATAARTTTAAARATQEQGISSTNTTQNVTNGKLGRGKGARERMV